MCLYVIYHRIYKLQLNAFQVSQRQSILYATPQDHLTVSNPFDITATSSTRHLQRTNNIQEKCLDFINITSGLIPRAGDAQRFPHKIIKNLSDSPHSLPQSSFLNLLKLWCQWDTKIVFVDQIPRRHRNSGWESGENALSLSSADVVDVMMMLVSLAKLVSSYFFF